MPNSPCKSRAFRVLGVKNSSVSPLHLLLNLLDLNLRLYENVLNKRNFCDIIKIEMEGYEMDGFRNLKFKGIFRDYQQRVLDN